MGEPARPWARRLFHAIMLILGLQVSSLFISVFQVLIPVSAVLLLISLALILRRTDPALLAAGF